MRKPRSWVLPGEPATAACLAAGGVSEAMLATQLRAGRLLRLRRGVYLAASAWPDDPAAQHLVLAHAEVAANPQAVVSHQSAAVFWGLPSPGFERWVEQPASVTLPAGQRFRTVQKAAEHHVAALPSTQVSRDHSGYLVTNLARTAVDLAAGLPLPAALVILDAAARRLCGSFLARPRRADFINPRLVRNARECLREVAVSRRRTGLLAIIELVKQLGSRRRSRYRQAIFGWRACRLRCSRRQSRLPSARCIPTASGQGTGRGRASLGSAMAL